MSSALHSSLLPHFRDIHQRQHLLMRLRQQFYDLYESLRTHTHTLLPKTMIRDMSQIRQRLLRTPYLPLDLAQLVRELDHKMSVPLSLMRWQRHDTREIVPHFRAFLLAEIPDHVIALVVVLRHHIEIERRHVEVERFVVQKELGDVRQILAIHALVIIAVPVHFEHAQIVLPVDLVAWRALRARPPPSLRRTCISACVGEAPSTLRRSSGSTRR